MVLCTPVASIEQLLEPISRQMDDGAVLTDVGGIKKMITAAARPDLWKAGVVAVCVDGAKESAMQRVAALHLGLGAEVVRCTAAEHDRAVASVFHLPLFSRAPSRSQPRRRSRLPASSPARASPR